MNPTAICVFPYPYSRTSDFAVFRRTCSSGVSSRRVSPSTKSSDPPWRAPSVPRPKQSPPTHRAGPSVAHSNGRTGAQPAQQEGYTGAALRGNHRREHDRVARAASRRSRTHLHALPGVAHNPAHYQARSTASGTLDRPVLATSRGTAHPAPATGAPVRGSGACTTRGKVHATPKRTGGRQRPPGAATSAQARYRGDPPVSAPPHRSGHEPVAASSRCDPSALPGVHAPA